MVWPITKRPQVPGSIHLTDAAFASQRMAVLAGAGRTEECALGTGKSEGGDTIPSWSATLLLSDYGRGAR